MALVGDVIVQVREAGPDPASFLTPPSFIAVGTAINPGGLIPSGTYIVSVSALNPWGETKGAPSASLTLAGANHTITVTVVLPAGSTAFRVYLSSPLGLIFGYIEFSSSILVRDVVSLSVLLPGVPPTRSTAMLPDSDGRAVGASSIYRWINDAISKAGRIAGGIPDVTGVKAIAGNAMYRITGKWIKFVNGWFDGWPITFGKRYDNFYHNTVVAIPGFQTLEQMSFTTTFQLWPQPNRTGIVGVVFSLAGMSDTAVTIQVQSSDIGMLPLGMVQIGDEIMSYSTIVPVAGDIFNLNGIVRGLGGTQPAFHATNSTVTELNIRLNGFRQPNSYSTGDSAKTLDLPPGWEEPLRDYVLAQYRKAEQATDEGQKLEKSFVDSIKEIALQSRPKTGPVQIGPSSREVYPGGWGGGILIP